MSDDKAAELARLRADLEVINRYSGFSEWVDDVTTHIHDKIARLEAEADPWREAKRLQVWLREAINREVVFFGATQVSEYLDHLTSENARLTARVAELEAKLMTRPPFGDSADIGNDMDKEIMDASIEFMKGIADMQPPFEGPIVGIEPVLDPARVLVTAREVLVERGELVFGGSKFGDAKPYNLK